MTGRNFPMYRLDSANKRSKRSLSGISALVNKVHTRVSIVKQVLITIASKSRNLNLHHQINLTGIQEPSAKLNNQWLIPERFKSILYKLEFPRIRNISKEIESLEPVFSMKRGVNFSPSILSIPFDQIALEKDENKELLNSILFLENLVGSNDNYPISLSRIRENNKE